MFPRVQHDFQLRTRGSPLYFYSVMLQWDRKCLGFLMMNSGEAPEGTQQILCGNAGGLRWTLLSRPHVLARIRLKMTVEVKVRWKENRPVMLQQLFQQADT
ncbi:hypothetical protein GOODEAATRI_000105 [Goodea atripinnis]|uniref:Uncharacterized protein n=1 Tax=Goodea atripinnis TaxID=208336 RepID=A0ABV0P079_9TELE